MFTFDFVVTYIAEHVSAVRPPAAWLLNLIFTPLCPEPRLEAAVPVYLTQFTSVARCCLSVVSVLE